MIGNRIKLLGILLGVSIMVFAVQCSWFHSLIGADSNAVCACDTCVAECEHMNGDVCACDDGGCGCPNCVRND